MIVAAVSPTLPHSYLIKHPAKNPETWHQTRLPLLVAMLLLLHHVPSDAVRNFSARSRNCRATGRHNLTTTPIRASLLLLMILLPLYRFPLWLWSPICSLCQ